MFSSSRILLLCFGWLASAATVTYDFNITWVTRNPDGLLNRPVIGINGQWPIPYITATVGDRVVVNVINQLGNESTSLHFHGLYQNGTSDMDGVTGVTQCPIQPGGSFTYNFTVDQPGTYWYHSHEVAQYPDGLRGPLIVHDPDSPYKGQYDDEIVLTVSDWYHDEIPNLMKGFISVTNPTGAEPVPNAALMNDTFNLTTPVEPGKTYMFRIINVGAFAGQYFWFEGHTMRIVEVDGIYTEAAEAELIYITPAQRYSVLVTTKNDTSTNYAFVGSMDESLFDTIPASLNPNATGWLVYDKSAPLPTPVLLDAFNEFDDYTLVPTDGEALLGPVDYSFTLDLSMNNLGNGASYAFFNDITYVRPKVPTLYTALSAGDLASNATIYGVNTNPYVLQHNDIIEIILNNNDTGKHPFHLHGHNFQAIARSNEDAGEYVGNETFAAVPMRRDTLMVRPMGNFVIPNTTSSPRIWFFHCHIEWHLASGLVATMIEAPPLLQSSLSIPADHYDVCKAQNLPIVGNAAGKDVDFLDLTGVPKPPGPLPEGFTPKGIVALVFSILTAFLGIAVISW
ncbi:iron transport multicopper oxidase FET3 precursor [Usnea florida]